MKSYSDFDSDKTWQDYLRVYFASMVKTPEFILQQEMDLWRGDGNRLPQVGSIEYCKMMKAIAAIDSAYVMYKADALIHQLNPTP